MKLNIEGLSRRFGADLWALQDLDLQAGRGLIAVLGPGGSGKSTLARILALELRPTKGRIKWDGLDLLSAPISSRPRIGYQPQGFDGSRIVTGRECLQFAGSMHGLDGRPLFDRIEQLLEHVDLVEAADVPMVVYNSGMKQRMGIAQALLNDPELMVIDGLSPILPREERARCLRLLEEASHKRIVFFSTNRISDAEAVANEVVILYGGRKLLQAPPDVARKMLEGKVWQWQMHRDALKGSSHKYTISGVAPTKAGIQLRAVTTAAPHPGAVSVAPRLEDVYLHHVFSAARPAINLESPGSAWG